jgi:hypothetical protein
MQTKLFLLTKQAILTSKTTESCKDVGAENGSHNVAQVGHVVDVRQGGGDENVLFPLKKRKKNMNSHGYLERKRARESESVRKRG